MSKSILIDSEQSKVAFIGCESSQQVSYFFTILVPSVLAPKLKIELTDA